MQTLQTERLTIRPLTLDDLDDIHRILDAAPDGWTLAQRRAWLDWTILSDAMHAALYQPPYGERAVVLRASGAVIGAVGLVSAFGAYDTLPYFRARAPRPETRLITPEMGLFWHIEAAQRGQGYATEAARALIDFAFGTLWLARVVATTDYDNAASVGVMRRLGMTIERNPYRDPFWFQIVGILENPKLATQDEAAREAHLSEPTAKEN